MESVSPIRAQLETAGQAGPTLQFPSARLALIFTEFMDYSTEAPKSVKSGCFS
jgi:hypothetical protein